MNRNLICKIWKHKFRSLKFWLIHMDVDSLRPETAYLLMQWLNPLFTTVQCQSNTWSNTVRFSARHLNFFVFKIHPFFYGKLILKNQNDVNKFWSCPGIHELNNPQFHAKTYYMYELLIFPGEHQSTYTFWNHSLGLDLLSSYMYMP